MIETGYSVLLVLIMLNKKAQLSLRNPCDAKPCGKVLQIDV